MQKVMLMHDRVGECVDMYYLEVDDDELSKLQQCDCLYRKYPFDQPSPDHPLNNWFLDWLSMKEEFKVTTLPGSPNRNPLECAGNSDIFRIGEDKN